MLAIIVAIGKNNVIGLNNELPWKLSGDLKYFAKITTGKSVLMGKNTFQSIINRLGKPLPNRKNYVLSSTLTSIDNIEIVTDLQKFIADHKDEEIYAIGGASVYQAVLPNTYKMYITEVDYAGPGDTFFPTFNRDEWKLVSEEKHDADDKNEYNYTFKTYERRS